jgi:hypothetical protein
MLCVVFLLVSKRADTLSAGAPEKYGLPYYWHNCAIVGCGIGFTVQTIGYILAEWVAIRGIAITDADDMYRASIRQSPDQMHQVRCWRTVCNLAATLMYLSLVITILGVVFMREPQEVKQTQGATSIRVGTVCSLYLAVAYFLVYFGLHVFRQREATRQGSTMETSFGLEIMKLAATAVNFAPMLCALFVGAQVATDWGGSGLSGDAAFWVPVCTWSVLLQVILVVLAPFAANAQLQVVGPHGEIDFVTYNNEIFVFISLIRWVAMITLYIGVAVVCGFLWATKSAPALSRELGRLAGVYFLAYLGLWGVITARQMFAGGYVRAIRVLTIAKDTVAFCPMLACLYLESFVRARGLVNSQGMAGAPQKYVQDFMSYAVVGLTVQVLLVCAAGVSAPKPTPAEPEPRKELSPVLLFCFHLAMAFVYFSIFVVVFGLFTISSANAG